VVTTMSVAAGTPRDQVSWTVTQPALREGAFYVCDFSGGSPGHWEVFVDLKDGRHERSHPEWWPVLLGRLRRRHPRLHGMNPAAFQALCDAPYAFPRGRLVVIRGKPIIYWGGEDVVRKKRAQIESALGVSRQVIWKHDEHEHTLPDDVAVARRALGHPIPQNAIIS
jgi:hypothetical protein